MPRVIHFEIHAENPERAVDFYSKIFGWKIYKWEGPVEYWLIETGPKDQPGINGGILRRREKVDSKAVTAFVCTIDVPSVDDFTDKILSNGGQVVVPKDAIPGAGWFAYCKDTEGNIFGLMQDDTNLK